MPSPRDAPRTGLSGLRAAGGRAAAGRAAAGLAAAMVVAMVASTAPSAGAARERLAPGSTTTLTYCTDGGVSLPMTLFEPTRTRRPAPAVLEVHGGGWEIGHRILQARDSATVQGLLRARFVVASVDYRLAPAARWPAQIEDVACALRFLRAEAPRLGIDPGRIGAWGTSAGGQLVSLLGTDGNDPAWATPAFPGQSAVPDAVVDGFGPADLTAPGWSPFLDRILTTVFGPDRAVRAAASPVDHVAPGDPPFLILQGTADTLVPPSQSIGLAARLRAAGDDVRLVLVQGGRHGLATPGEVPSARWLSEEIVRFFLRTLDQPRP